jgi:hypothetical protein
MQVLLAVLVVAGSTAWLAVDASKRDWTDNGFAKNVPTWVIGSLLLWPIVLGMYVFVHRKKAPLLAKPEAAPAAAMSGPAPSEQYGPSIDEVEQEEPTPEPEPVVEIEPEPVVEPEPVMEISQPEPVVDVVPPEPVMEISQPEPVDVVPPEPVIEPQPVVDVVPPEPVIEPQPVVAMEPPAEPEYQPEYQPQPEPVTETGPEPEPVLDISFPQTAADEAPPGLSVDAFKDIKPVAFGGIVVEETPRAPEPEVAPQPEPAIEVHPEPIVETPAARDFEPLSYPGVEDVPPLEPEFASEPAVEPEPAMTPAVADPVVEETVTEEPKPKKRGFRIPNPQLKLPSFGKKAKADAVPPAGPKSKGGLKLPQITLPDNLQGPLSDLERKIALGAVLAIVAAGAFGYSSAPSDDAGAPPPTPAPTAVSR